MKLNKRVSLLIVPVIIASYLAIFLSVYYFEKDAYLKQAQSRVNLHLSHLTAIYTQYENFIDSYFSTLINNPAFQKTLLQKDSDLLAYSMERNLTTAIDHMPGTQVNTLNVIIMNADKKIGTVQKTSNLGSNWRVFVHLWVPPSSVHQLTVVVGVRRRA